MITTEEVIRAIHAGVFRLTVTGRNAEVNLDNGAWVVVCDNPGGLIGTDTLHLSICIPVKHRVLKKVRAGFSTVQRSHQQIAAAAAMLAAEANWAIEWRVYDTQ